MDPNQPAPQQPYTPNGFNSNQFDFIMNPGQPPKKSLLPSGPKQKIIAIGLLGAVGVIVFIVLFSLIFNSGPDIKKELLGIAQQQSEIIRISESGITKSRDSSMSKFATLTKVTVSSDQQKTVAYLAKQGKKVSGKELSAKQSAASDKALADAEQNGRFDEVFKETLTTALGEYQKSLKNTYGHANKSGKELLDQNYVNVSLILEDIQR